MVEGERPLEGVEMSFGERRRVLVKADCWLQYGPAPDVPSPTPAPSTGGLRRSRARSGVVIT